MNFRLTPAQIEYLRTQPPEDGTRIPIALRLLNANQREYADHIGLKPQQLSGWLAGDDLLLSNAFRLAAPFGLSVCDVWTEAPGAKRKPKAKKANGNSKRLNSARSKGPRAEAA